MFFFVLTDHAKINFYFYQWAIVLFPFALIFNEILLKIEWQPEDKNEEIRRLLKQLKKRKKADKH
ncbi:MAG: hypothetical protein Kow00108_13510 [Calditrichia bacterium]